MRLKIPKVNPEFNADFRHNTVYGLIDWCDEQYKKSNDDKYMHIRNVLTEMRAEIDLRKRRCRHLRNACVTVRENLDTRNNRHIEWIDNFEKKVTQGWFKR